MHGRNLSVSVLIQKLNESFKKHLKSLIIWNVTDCLMNSNFYISTLNSTFFNANPRPDALMKEQLVEMTGLSPRVIRVWFQNKRCKHNKKTNALKIQMEQEKVGNNVLM